MKPNEGRLQTAEHILARIVQNRFSVEMGICTFDEIGRLEMFSDTDLRGIDLQELEEETNKRIAQNLPVSIQTLPRQEAEKLVSLRRVPACAGMIRIVSIGDFDTRACRDPHVDNTRGIGKLSIQKLERVGQGRYRFSFQVA